MISYKEYKTSSLDKKMMRKILIEKQLVKNRINMIGPKKNNKEV